MADELSQLQRHFGNNLDKEVLAAVLEMCNNNLQQAIQFLEIQNNDQQQVAAYEQHVRHNNSSSSTGGTLPQDYHRKPDNWMQPQAPKSSASSSSSSSNNYLDRALALRKLFIEDSSLEAHIKMQLEDPTSYTAVLLILLYQGVEISHVTKSRTLAGLWARKQYQLTFEYLLVKYEKLFGLIEVLRALKILDAPRKVKCMEKRIAKLQTAKARTINKIRGQINDVKQEMVPEHLKLHTSVSGSLAKKVRKWITSISKEQLQFFALHLPKEPWQELADIIHCSPADFKLDYFLKVTFGDAPPQDSVIEACKTLTSSNLLEIVKKYNVPYSYLRKKVPQMSLEVRKSIVTYETIDTVLWWYEELTAGGANAAELDPIIAKRLEEGQIPNFGYGKLMERLLLFKQMGTCFFNQLLPIAEAKLQHYRLPLEPVVVVAGDASFSMDVAIRTSTIISSVVVAMTSGAELKFFNVKAYDAPTLPKSAAQVLELSTTTKADGLTAPACLLWDYYSKKRPIKLFIMVTDEIENEKSEGSFFAQLFYKYYTEVHAAKIMFISFVENPNTQTKGRMCIALEQMGIQPLVFTLDATRPDLTKLDKIIGILSSETTFFGVQVDYLAKSIGSKNIISAVQDLQTLPQPEVQRGSAASSSSSSSTPKVNDSLVANAPSEAQVLAVQAPEQQQQQKQEIKPQESNNGKQPAVSAPAVNLNIDEQGTPLEFLCPITHDLMTEPVIAADGFSYEKTALLKWFESHDNSPMTGAKLEVKIVFPNHQLRSRIVEYQELKKAISK